MSSDDFNRRAGSGAVLLKAMGNERRLMILRYLSEGEKSVTQLEHLVCLSQSALSQHLARLRRDNLVRARRDAQCVFYSLKGDAATVIIAALDSLQFVYPRESRDADYTARVAA